jgi:hypothetical protein
MSKDVSWLGFDMLSIAAWSAALPLLTIAVFVKSTALTHASFLEAAGHKGGGSEGCIANRVSH